MQEYLKNGLCLGLLINRKTKQIEIYRQGQAVDILDSPTTLSGEDVHAGSPPAVRCVNSQGDEAALLTRFCKSAAREFRKKYFFVYSFFTANNYIMNTKINTISSSRR